MTFHVTVLPAAREDLYGILAWINERSPQGAAAWFARWNGVLESLAFMPAANGLAPEDEYHDREVRQILFRTRRGRTYRALFTIREHDVVVLRIQGEGQDLLTPEELHLPND